MAQPKSRLPLLIGLTAAGGVGYYLYTAGGSPKAAQKQFEADVSKATSKIKSEVPEVKQKGEQWATETGAKIDSAADKAKAEVKQGAEKLDKLRVDAGKDAMAKIDKFDATVEKEAAKAKSGISSWFGLGGK